MLFNSDRQSNFLKGPTPKDLIKSMNYFETINLLTMIFKANNPEWSEHDCYSEATATFADNEKMSFLIEEMLETGIHSS